MEKVVRNGKVAVIYSPGCGAGWYSWNSGNKELLFSPKIVEMIESGKVKEIDEDWIKANLGIDDIYCVGAYSLKIQWINEGTAFRVDEYDGSESITTADDFDCVA